MGERVKTKAVAAWIAVAVVVLAIVFSFLVAAGVITDNDADTILEDVSTAVPLVETAIAIE